MGPLMKSSQIMKWWLPAAVGIFFLGYPAVVLWASTTHTMTDFESIPISIIENSSTPQVQINASNDHQLFFKAYNDYTDLDVEVGAETTYKHSIDYYGYFDSYKCYTYDDTKVIKRFEPKSLTSDKYCQGVATTGEWSGNFLNWAAMTRIDAIRKILFGGHRRVDTTDETVLERAFIPPDIHAFAKHYDGTDLPRLTPFSSMSPLMLASTATTSRSVNTVSTDFDFATDPSATFKIGEYVAATSQTNSANIFMRGWVTAVNAGTKTVTVNVIGASDFAPHAAWTITNTLDPAKNYANTTSLTIGTGKKKFTFSPVLPGTLKMGDALKITDNLSPGTRYMEGKVSQIDDTNKYIVVDVTNSRDDDFHNDWNVANLTRTGITLCNVTYSSENKMSEYISDPPLIRVANGNYAFWANGEVHQCLWKDEDTSSNGTNYNNPEYSGIPAHQDTPYKADGLGKQDYVARVVACKDLSGDLKYDSNDGSETCKQYSQGSPKPIGLLQEYGDNDRMLFGMIAGTYGKSKSGGDMISPLFVKNGGAYNMCAEINLGKDCDNNPLTEDDLTATGHVPGDGTFKKVFSWVGGPASKQDAAGIINSWSIYRIKGYQYSAWNYDVGDKCPLSVKYFGTTSDSVCTNWGNPFSEIYLTALRHWAGLNSPVAYQSNDAIANSVFDGLNYLNGVWADPLTENNYCAKLSIINFSSSVSSVDTAFGKEKDELDSNSQGIVKDLDSPYNSIALTNQIGVAEGISDSGKTWFIGETTKTSDLLCTAKEIPELGNARGLCPEGPGLRGGYRIAGMAWYAHTNDIRPSTLTGNRGLKEIQTVDNYSVRLASGNPLMKIPVPGSNKVVTIIPSCIDNNKDNNGCTLTDFKILAPHELDSTGTIGRGKFLATWEDSLQGSDFDLDAGGTYEYEITNSTIKVTTAVTLENLGHSIGHGYTISGTTQDGPHFHSGTNNFKYTDKPGIQDCAAGCFGIVDGGTSTTVTYNIGTSVGQTLQDPLWYVAKWGGFLDKNGDKKPGPDSTEWDSKDNKSGENSPDGIPDNYFYASHPKELEHSLRTAFNMILERTSSGTAAAVVASNVRGEGALFQAFYEPLKKQDGKETSWIGTLQALWLDSYGQTRQDCSPPTGYIPGTSCPVITGTCVPNGILDDYCVDKVVETYLDTTENRTRAKIFSSNATDSFNSFSMQGVVQSYSSGSGSVTMVPNSLEGRAAYVPDTHTMTLSPYSLVGVVDSYDDATGAVSMTVQPSGWQTPFGSGIEINSWDVENLNTNDTGKSSSNITLPGALPSSSQSVSFTVSPAGTWITAGQPLTLTTKRPVGRLGDDFTAWDVLCLSGGAAVGAKGNFINDDDKAITIRNTGVDSFAIDNVVGDFTDCTAAIISSYNMQGTSGASYSSWKVSDLETNFEGGTSSSAMTLTNSGAKSFSVSPVTAWLTINDRVLVANNSFTTVELNEIGYLWNAREELYLNDIALPDTTLLTNRTYNAKASDGGRYITTWVDSDLDGEITAGEYKNFDSSMFTSGSPPVKYGFFDVSTQAEAEKVVNYVRGIELANTRNRTVRYSPSDSKEHVMRLGDIINSTPTVVGSPQEAFNILYADDTYDDFRRKYQDRRVMLYAGGNDGLFHAFNGGFYKTVAKPDYYINTVQYSKSGYNWGPSTSTAATEHNLGAEIWAYAPYNLLSHLQWLKDPAYASSHVYFMDAKPRIFDAKIFAADDNHPNGWGTVLVAGMNLGGGSMLVDSNSDGHGVGKTADDVTLHSAYVVLDITNPENPPVVLGEIPMPDNSFTTVTPAVLAFKDAVKEKTGTTPKVCTDVGANCVNKWYLQFGTGPDSIANYTSAQTTKMYLFDLAQLTTGPFSQPSVGTSVFAADAANPTTCSVIKMTTHQNIIKCDTGVPGSFTFMGTPVVVDWDLDFYADTSYFGLVGDANASTGQLMRFSLHNTQDFTQWDKPKTFFKPDLPILAQPVPAVDDQNRHWVFFGSGRYFAPLDKTSTARQSLFGVMDDETKIAVSPSSLLNVTEVEVYTDSTLNAPLATVVGDPFGTATSLTSFDQLLDYMDGKDDHTLYGPMGWRLDLPPIVGTLGVSPATRNTTRSALLGGVLFSSAFQPSDDACVGEGESRLYGLYYKTGTAYPGPTIFGTAAENVSTQLKYRALKYISLGAGVATAPSIHSGTGSGTNQVEVFTQQSTGNIVRVPAEMVESVRTGKTSWIDK